MSQTISQVVEQYLEAKGRVWTASSRKSERARLRTVAELLDGNPEKLWAELQTRGTSPYTCVHVWNRVTAFWNWAQARGLVKNGNPYAVFREENSHRFEQRRAYRRQFPTLSFRDALARISTLDAETQAKAKQLLFGGLRWEESLNVVNGRIVGKGNYDRAVYVESTEWKLSYRTFLRRLATVGLKPHDLRKLCAMKLNREEGVKEQDLLAIMGWSSMQTAQSYLAPMQEDERAKVMARLREGQGGPRDEHKPAPALKVS